MVHIHPTLYGRDLFSMLIGIKYPSFCFNALPYMLSLTTLGKKFFENIVGKGENAGNQHFPVFPQCFLPYQRKDCTILTTVKLSCANAFNKDKANILSSGK